MPNWVMSTLEVIGPAEELKDFIEFSKGPDGAGVKDEKESPLSAMKYIPIPVSRLVGRCEGCGYVGPELKDYHGFSLDHKCPKCGVNARSGKIKDWFNNGGYEWCNRFWGTKWGFCNVKMSGDPRVVMQDGVEVGAVLYSFDTAWSTIDQVIVAMAARYPMLEFRYTSTEESGAFTDDLMYFADGERKTVDNIASHVFVGQRDPGTLKALTNTKPTEKSPDAQPTV